MAKSNRLKAEPEMIEFPQSYRVVAGDLSLKRPGFCILFLQKTEEETRIIDIKVFSVDNKTDKKKEKGELLDDVLRAMAFNFPDEEKDGIATYYVREKRISSHFSDNTVYEAVGITDWFLWKQGKVWLELYPTTIKKLITGSGKAEKDQVAECLKLYVGDIQYSNDDESDATAVAVAWLINNGEIKQKEVAENG